MSKAAELANLIGNINAGGGGVNRNVIINGAMNVAQKGTSHTGLGGSTGAVYTLDRFCTFDSATAGRATVTQDSSAPSGFANSLKVACTTADTSIAAGEQFLLQQRIEGQNLQAFAKGSSDAKPFAVSFYVKGNASATYACELFDRDNTRQASKLFNVTTDWTRIELTFDADTTGAFDDDNARSLDFIIQLHAGSNYTSGTLNQTFASNTAANRAVGISSFFDSTSRTFFITGVQLEVGQNATEFEHEPYESTLSKCLRYYQKTFIYSQAPVQDPPSAAGTIAGPAHSDSAYKNVLQWWFQEHMRATPTITFYNPYFSNANFSKSGYDGPTAGLYSSSEKHCAVRDDGGGAINTNLQVHADAKSEL
tara:strand:+ start:764 stop:1861 length:1098 start_codon:yes stop_codon:yes gene_type:complete